MSSSLPLMKFKTFVWPNNPKAIEVMHKTAGGEDSGGEKERILRIVRGEGEFFGHSAVKSYMTLAGLMHDKTPGGLYLPGIGFLEAVLCRISLIGEPGPCAVRYGFEFQEAAKAFVGETDKKYYEAEVDTSLWEIANAFGVKVERLAELNPQIKNPSFVKAGSKVRVR